MEDFKLRIFEREHQGRSFPEHPRLPPDISRRLRQDLAERAGLSVVEGMALLKTLFERSHSVEHANAESDDFNLIALARSLDLEPEEEVYVNWDDFTTIIHMRFEDFHTVSPRTPVNKG